MHLQSYNLCLPQQNPLETKNLKLPTVAFPPSLSVLLWENHFNLRQGCKSYHELSHLQNPIHIGQSKRNPDQKPRNLLLLRSNLRRWKAWLVNSVGYHSRGWSLIALSAGSRTRSKRQRLVTVLCRFWLVKCITVAMVFQETLERDMLGLVKHQEVDIRFGK